MEPAAPKSGFGDERWTREERCEVRHDKQGEYHQSRNGVNRRPLFGKPLIQPHQQRPS